MSEDADPLLDAITALVPALLTALEALSEAGRRLHPGDVDAVVAGVLGYQTPLEEGIASFQALDWPPHLQGFRDRVLAAAAEAGQAFAALSASLEQTNPLLGAYRALGFHNRALETLYPVAFMLPPVSRFYLTGRHRNDAALQERLRESDPGRETVGIFHASNEREQRGGFSLYIPEYYDGQPMPLVVALHGGSGHGRSFLWSWLRDARSRGLILASPTSAGPTWALQGPDVDSGRLDELVARICDRWQVDEGRVLLTGMSDGGTFTYLGGLRSGTAFTHLAPIAASFHPLLLEVVEPERLRDLPIYLTHGAMDWMFSIDVARGARDAFTAAGARLTYREIDDLSHTYPKEENDLIVDWLLE